MGIQARRARLSGSPNRGSAQAARYRSLELESFEPRTMLAADVGSAAQLLALDVTTDGAVDTRDLISVVRDVTAHGSRRLSPSDPASQGRRVFDADLDDTVSARDAIHLMRHLMQSGSSRIDPWQLAGRVPPAASEIQRAVLSKVFQRLNQLRSDHDVSPRDMMQVFDKVLHAVESGTKPADSALAAFEQAWTQIANSDELSVAPQQLARQLEEILNSLAASRSEPPLFQGDLQGILGQASINDLKDLYGQIGDLLPTLPLHTGSPIDMQLSADWQSRLESWRTWLEQWSSLDVSKIEIPASPDARPGLWSRFENAFHQLVNRSQARNDVTGDTASDQEIDVSAILDNLHRFVPPSDWPQDLQIAWRQIHQLIGQAKDHAQDWTPAQWMGFALRIQRIVQPLADKYLAA